LALAYDVVFAAKSARFIQVFSKIGLLPDAGWTWFLPRQIGSARAMGAALFAEPVSARQAEEWGLIWRCVPDADWEKIVLN
jgi:2-(1,2-epoxy-1,2-dihydrophenyl)acetyl-CoA isomerase